METRDDELRFTLRVLNAKRKPLGGLVDIRIEAEASGASMVFKGRNASKAIEIHAPQRVPPGDYKIVVTTEDGSGAGSATVKIGPEGPYKFSVLVHRSGIASITHTVQGTLIFDHGHPAAGVTVRLYAVGFGGQDQSLGETTSGAKGDYAFAYSAPGQGPVNVQVRVVDPAQKEITISATKFRAAASETLNLVVPQSVQPLASEFERLSSDMAQLTGGVAGLGQAREDAARQDLRLLNQSSSWDARVVALAAIAAKHTQALRLSADSTQVLYALYRVGLPTEPQHLASVPATVVQAALTKANQAGVVNLTGAQMTEALASFQRFSEATHLAATAVGAVSNFSDLLAANLSADQRATFSSLYFANPNSGSELWTKAAAAGLPAQAVDSLKLQGKFLYLTLNSGPLAQRLQQDIGAIENLPQLPDKNYHLADTWKTALTGLAGAGGDAALNALIPGIYPGKTTADRLQAYSADLARKVRVSFPTQVTARMVETGAIAIKDTAPGVTAFLRAATQSGYELGRTPLNAFLQQQGRGLPAMDAATTESVKTLHRLYQVTPSPESLQGAFAAGLTSAYQIASYTHDDFIHKYVKDFPSYQEASLVYRKAWLVSSVTFNFFSMAKQLDTAPPVYGISAPDSDRQNAKDAIVKQFPSMASLFGSLDFCQCEECRSVLSPSAYFVDLLEFLRKSDANAAGNTPLDVLVGKDEALPGRRPDLAALPLTCENTNTALPYIDLVNEILEYYIAHNHLDANAAYDTGDAGTPDLIAEPQHILPAVYSTTLKKALYPRSLPFDLWIETVRGFLDYFHSPLATVLETLRPADKLELFTDGNTYPYYRAQILAESLGLSPAEYHVFTATDPAQWFQLYGYGVEATALASLPSAKTLAQRLDLSYQDLVDLVTTGFLNPGLNALIFQFNRFHIDLHTAFTYTGQPGFTAKPLSPQEITDFETLLNGITARYKAQDPASTFDAKTWLKSVLPANYSKKVLILRDPDTGCNFNSTTLQYADGTAATALDYLKVNLFVRLWKKLGWSLDEIDRALQLFFPPSLPAWTDPGFAAAFNLAWKTALVYLAHLDDLNIKLSPAMGRTALLPLWESLATQGSNPLYAQLMLAPGVLTNDPSFDDPAGLFPWATGDPLSAHLAAVEGVLGLTSQDIAAILADAGASVTTVNMPAVPGFSLINLSICYRYSLLAHCLQLSVADMIALKTLSGLNPFQPLSGTALSVLADDILLNQTLAFLTAAATVQNSGFTIEDLKYLLRQQYDPAGKYQVDTNTLMALVQSTGSGLRQIQNENTVPPRLGGLPQSVIDQRLSGLFPAGVLKALFAQITNSLTSSASQGGVAPGAKLDPAPFAGEDKLSFGYDAVTQVQTVSYQGLLLDWKKSDLLQINNSPLFSGLLNGLQLDAQKTFQNNFGNVLGVWASLAQYEAVRTAAAGLNSGPLTQVDPALSLSYDQAGKLQWLGYRGVLTDAKKVALTNVNNDPILAQLLNDVQQQAMPTYTDLAGNIVALWANLQSYEALQAGVAPANAIDPSVFAAHPEIQFAYDPVSQTQRLTYQGVLSDANRILLAGLIPANAVLATLLQTARTEAVQLFQKLTAGLLTGVTPAIVDTYSAPYLQEDNAQKQKRVKAKLVTAFLPLLARKLSRDLVVKALAGSLASDQSLTSALVTDAAYLSDPSNPGQSLLGAFLATGTAGVSATYFASANGTGVPLATGTASTTNTDDPTNPNAGKAGTGSAHFEGYLQVPTDGPYRFLAELGNLNSSASLRLDPPDPSAFLNNPVVSDSLKAAKDHDEVSQFVQLKGGALYHFTLDFSALGANGASLLIQGENLPKGPLSQVVLYPQQAVQGFLRARLLLAKAMQILQGMSLGEREASYLTANAAQFHNLRLSSLPTLASDDTVAQATALFSQFLALADYTDLRKGPAGGSDGLVDVFQNTGQVFTEPLASQDATNDPRTPWKRLADLTRRDAQVIRDVARYFGLIQETPAGPLRQVQAVGDFGNNTGVRRIWQALQLLQIVGIPVSALTSATVIASAAPPMGSPAPDVIAASLKNAVKAQYAADAWRPIAQSVFDKLRRKKRDALVAYLVNSLGLENSNQLFEYFLVDPGMEPVVQTSRLRLAISSVQTFIQRCLFDLENGNTAHPERNVSPRVIEADWWEWMKRYRVWEANRKIFLYPENWMEPELRLDKTDLFKTMEGALLQGDVTRDLVEDAFLDYLKGLDQRARLDVVAMYLDQNPTHLDVSTLYVLGRTYGVPHKYFFRTYSSGTWSGWETVTPDIEGNHMVLVVWRGRLNLFWVTFTVKADPPSAPPAGGDPVTKLGFGDLVGQAFGSQATPVVQVHLHWSEYFKGKWSNRLSTDPGMNQVLQGLDHPASNLNNGFDANSSIYIHVSKEVDSNGNEGAVKIHLDVQGYDTFMSFRVTGKNSAPDFSEAYHDFAPAIPYTDNGINATLYTGATQLEASFMTEISVDGTENPTWTTEPILHTVDNFEILACANPVSPPFLDPNEPSYWDAGGLVSPFFFKDTHGPNGSPGTPFFDEQTFFVQPSLTEQTVTEWKGWALPPPTTTVWQDPRAVLNTEVLAQVPAAGPVRVNPPDPVYSLFPLRDNVDWVVQPSAVITYGDSMIGKGGGISQPRFSAGQKLTGVQS